MRLSVVTQLVFFNRQLKQGVSLALNLESRPSKQEKDEKQEQKKKPDSNK